MCVDRAASLRVRYEPTGFHSRVNRLCVRVANATRTVIIHIYICKSSVCSHVVTSVFSELCMAGVCNHYSEKDLYITNIACTFGTGGHPE
jgi:hypothetical protein